MSNPMQPDITGLVHATKPGEDLFFDMYMDVISTTSMLVFVCNTARRVVYVSPSTLIKAGIEEKQSLGMLASDLLTRLNIPADEVAIEHRVASYNFTSLHEINIASGMPQWIECRNSTITTPSGESLFQFVVTDVTDRYQTNFAKQHDILTGLYNYDAMEKKAADMDMKQEYPFTVLCADINNLKLINNSQGREMGDKVLCEVARIIEELKPANGIAGRFNGDEFGILMPNTDRKAASIIKEKLVKAVMQCCSTGMVITVCAGYVTKESDDNLSYQQFMDKLRKSIIKDKLNNRVVNKTAAINYRLDLLSVPGQDERRRAQRISDLSAAVAKSLHCNEETKASAARVAFLIKLGRQKGNYSRMETTPSPTAAALPVYEAATNRVLAFTSALDPSPRVAEAIISYHENWDGSGIPHGLKGKKISQISRIVRVSEALVTMIEDTPSSPHISTAEAIKNIRKQSGKLYDPLAVDVLAATLSLGKLEAVLDPWI